MVDKVRQVAVWPISAEPAATPVIVLVWTRLAEFSGQVEISGSDGSFAVSRYRAVSCCQAWGKGY